LLAVALAFTQSAYCKVGVVQKNGRSGGWKANLRSKYHQADVTDDNGATKSDENHNIGKLFDDIHGKGPGADEELQHKYWYMAKNRNNNAQLSTNNKHNRCNEVEVRVRRIFHVHGEVYAQGRTGWSIQEHSCSVLVARLRNTIENVTERRHSDLWQEVQPSRRRYPSEEVHPQENQGRKGPLVFEMAASR